MKFGKDWGVDPNRVGRPSLCVVRRTSGYLPHPGSPPSPGHTVESRNGTDVPTVTHCTCRSSSYSGNVRSTREQRVTTETGPVGSTSLARPPRPLPILPISTTRRRKVRRMTHLFDAEGGLFHLGDPPRHRNPVGDPT